MSHQFECAKLENSHALNDLELDLKKKKRKMGGFRKNWRLCPVECKMTA